MKTSVKSFLLLGLLFVAFFDPHTGHAQRNRNAEQVASRCDGLPFDERIRLSVARFSVSNRNAQAQFGNEIATILSNALVETSCFQVLARLDNSDDWEEEIAYGAGGNTASGSSPEMGGALGAQAVIIGEITEYQDEFISIGPVGTQRAQIGFVLQVMNPATRQIIFSRSFDKRKNKPGASSGVRLFGVQVTGVNLKTQAMADILEEAILEAVGALVSEQENISSAVGGPSTVEAPPSFDAGNCDLLRNGPPSVMVIIPEVHISRPAPDPAGETEIIRQLIEAGFRVVDPSVYASIRDNERVNAASKDAGAAATLGAEFGADIIIIGEAFSESIDRTSSNMFSCRARVEARAVSTTDATILGADGRHAGGVDISELTAAKVALRNAGGEMARYFLEALCKRSSLASSGGGGKTLTVNVANASFSALSQLERALAGHGSVQSVDKSLAGNTGTLTVRYTGAVDPLADIIASGSGVDLEITEFSDSKIGVLLK